MAIQTYDELTAAILAWLARTNDPADPVVQNLKSYVTLCEGQINNQLRASVNQRRSWAYINEPVEGVPDDFMAIDSAAIFAPNDRTWSLTQISVDALRQRYTLPGNPAYFAIAGSQILFGPYVEHDDAAVEADLLRLELVYYAAVPTITTAAQGSTNAVLQRFPELYLYGSLMFAHDFIVADRLAQVQSMFQSSMDAANLAGQDSLYGPMVQSPPDVMIV